MRSAPTGNGGEHDDGGFVEFRDVFLSEFTADDCIGPGADAYRASVDLYGEDAAGRPAAVVTPPDAAGCVAEQAWATRMGFI